jgi:hypothetical protein
MSKGLTSSITRPYFDIEAIGQCHRDGRTRNELPDTRARNVTSNDLRATVVVVTGKASGIGYALANAHRPRGGASVLIADRDEPALETPRVSLTDFRNRDPYAPGRPLRCSRGCRARGAGQVDRAHHGRHLEGTRRGRRVRARRQLVGDHMTNMTEPSRSRDTLGHRVSCFEIGLRKSERETVDDCHTDD